MAIEKVPLSLWARVSLYLSKKAYCFYNVIDKAAIFFARRKQKKIIDGLKNKDHHFLNDFEKKTMQRNFFIDKIHSTYTIFRNNTLIITRIVHLKVFKDGDLVYRFEVIADNYKFPNSKNNILNNANRFSGLSFAYKLMENSRKSNKNQKINCKTKIDNEKNKFIADITIRSCQKGQKLVLAISMSVPEEINKNDEFPIITKFITPVGVWEFEFQEEVYGNKNPQYTANIEDIGKKVYFPLSFKSIYYDTHKWKIRYKPWQGDGEITFKIRSV